MATIAMASEDASGSFVAKGTEDLSRTVFTLHNRTPRICSRNTAPSFSSTQLFSDKCNSLDTVTGKNPSPFFFFFF
jgi:hypothetical protein